MFNLDIDDESNGCQIPSRKRTRPAAFLGPVVAVFTTLAQLLQPSFLDTPAEKASKTTAHTEARTLTTALDGVRGYAAVAVMNYHILYAYRTDVFYAYGLSESAAISCARPEDVHAFNRWLHQLPIARLVYGGTWPISVFYVISGIALSFRPLGLDGRASLGSPEGMAAIASALLRRPFRLYGPPIVATFLTMLVIQAGGYEHGRMISNDKTWVSVINETHHQRLASLGQQILDWAHQTGRMFHVFWWGDLHNQYDVHLWTIPVEFRCSLALFLILPAYLMIRPRPRKVLLSLLVIYVYGLDRWDVALFYCGLLIADTLPRPSSPADALPLGRRSPRARPIISASFRAIKVLLFALSLFLLSAPDFCVGVTPGYRLLARLIPSSDPAPFRFLPNVGAVVLIFLIVHTRPESPLVFGLLNSAVPQYLGRISYSLYIVHGPLIHTVGYVLFPLFWKISGRDELWQYLAGFTMANLGLVSITVYVADRFWHLVDLPCVRLATAFHGLVVLEGKS